MNFKKRVNGSWTNTPHYIHKTDTDTITTLPADVYADGTNATVGISGNTTQNGTPTPDNPIMPQGTGERTGNLYNINAKDVTNGYVNNAQLNQDGTTEAWNSCEVTEYIELTPNETYRLSEIGSYNSLAYCIYDSDKQYITGEKYSGQLVKVINMPSNGKYLRFSHVKSRTDTMINTGSTAPPYEPYGYKIPISSASTTTPVYLGEVQTTRKIKKLVFDGTEPWVLSGNIVFINNTDTEKLSPLICTHFPNVANAGMWNGNNLVFQVDISRLGMSGRDAWITWLAAQYAAGTPVTVWYVLASEKTAVVNEPLMRIGDYADTVNNITIPVTAGGDTLSVDTTVQPSEVSLSYTGWHDATVKEWDGSQWG